MFYASTINHVNFVNLGRSNLRSSTQTPGLLIQNFGLHVVKMKFKEKKKREKSSPCAETKRHPARILPRCLPSCPYPSVYLFKSRHNTQKFTNRWPQRSSFLCCWFAASLLALHPRAVSTLIFFYPEVDEPAQAPTAVLMRFLLQADAE